MRTAKNAIAVGIITVVMATGLYFVLKFVSESAHTDGQYRLYAIFPDASGVVPKSQIKTAGIVIGYIDTIKLHEYMADVEYPDAGVTKKETRVGARIDFVVHGDVSIYGNGRAFRSASGLLGNQFVVITPGDSKHPKLKDGDEIKNVSEAGLMGHLEEITDDISEVTANLRNVFGSDEGGRNMGEALSNLRDISNSLKELLEANSENVNKTLNNINVIASEARPNVKYILEDIKKITSEVRVFVETSTGKAGNVMDEADGTVRDLRTVVAKLDKTLENLEDVTGGLKDGEGTVGRLLKDEKLIDDVEEVVEDASGLVKGITDLKTIVGIASEYNFYGNSMKTGLSLRLQPREDKYYLIEAVYDPGGVITEVERTVESNHPDEPALYQETIRTRRSALLFSFMYARRLNFATFRLGIKESSGGLGVDFHLLRDRIELSTDIYRFSDDVYPRLKELVAIEFLKHLYVIGGVNDVLNDNRDYFVGLMLRFNDEDLKTMLPFMPAP